MAKCPQCAGKKTITIEVHEGGKKAYSEELPCPTCRGAGKASPAQAQRHAAMEAAWCRCEVKAPGSVGENIHHDGAGGVDAYYHIPGCGKLVQVG